MLNELKIKRYCDVNKYSYRYFNDTVVVITGLDAWELTDMGNRILVRHINKYGNKKGKMQFHPQRIAYDVDWIFKNIITSHKNNNGICQRVLRMKKIIAEIT